MPIGIATMAAMIPSIVAHEVSRALQDFLATGFGPSNPALASVLDEFLSEGENLVKGPYLSIALPPKMPGITPPRRASSSVSMLAIAAYAVVVTPTRQPNAIRARNSRILIRLHCIAARCHLKIPPRRWAWVGGRRR